MTDGARVQNKSVEFEEELGEELELGDKSGRRRKKDMETARVGKGKASAERNGLRMMSKR